MCFYIYSQKASIINSIDKQKYTDFQYSPSDCFKGEDLISPTYLLIEKSCPINFLEKNLRQQSIKFSCIKCFSVIFHKHLKEDQVLMCFFLTAAVVVLVRLIKFRYYKIRFYFMILLSYIIDN